MFQYTVFYENFLPISYTHTHTYIYIYILELMKGKS